MSMNINMSRPIPTAFLPHTAVLRTPKPGGVFAGGDYNEVTLYNVRIEENVRYRQSKNGEARVRGAAMYFDCVNSYPVDTKFESGQQVLFSGEDYRIEAVKSVLTADRIHHYKVELT